MLLILEEYFRAHPTKMRIVEGLYDRGISVSNSKFYSGGLELSVSEVAKFFMVNRRTVYETIRMIEETPGVREIMANIRPGPSLREIAPLMGDQIVSLYVCQGFFSRAMNTLMETIRPYGSYIKELYGKNQNREEILLRVIFYRTVPKSVFEEFSRIEGVDKIVIESPDLSGKEPICSKCEVRVCQTKLSTGIFEESYSDI